MNSKQLQLITVFEPETTIYSAQARNTSVCIASSTLKVTVYSHAFLVLPKDTSICKGDLLKLLAPDGFNAYEWRTGVTTPTITVEDAGKYSTRAKDNNGCYFSAQFTLLQVYTPLVQLNKDLFLWLNDDRILNAGVGYASYLWNTGVFSQKITVSRVGTYYVQVKDQKGYTGSDTTSILKFLHLPLHFLPDDTTVCNFGTILIQAQEGYSAHLWNTGELTSAVTIRWPNTYLLQVTDENGFEGKDTISIAAKQCMEGIQVPNAFTPNGDGKYDLFKPMVFSAVQSYLFTIYNRWGEKVFETTEQGKGLNGEYKGSKNTTNTFICNCKYQITWQF